MEYSDRAEWRSSHVRDITCLPNLDPELFCACRCAHSQIRKHCCLLTTTPGNPRAKHLYEVKFIWDHSETIFDHLWNSCLWKLTKENIFLPAGIDLYSLPMHLLFSKLFHCLLQKDSNSSVSWAKNESSFQKSKINKGLLKFIVE